MKTAIMTLALSDNYGAALQTCGLAHAIETLGHDATVYRYQNYARMTHGLSALGLVKYKAFRMVKTILTQNQRKKRFDAFRETYLPLTPKFYGNNDALLADPGDFDVYISGSDQIWNPKLFIFDYSYFLDFVPEGKKKISFASSFGKADFEESYKEKCGKLLSEFSHISVREKSGEAIVADLCGKNATTCVDPTLLLNKQDWAPMMENASQKAKAFNGIVCYFMPGDKLVTDAIESVAQQLHKKTGLPIMRLGIKEHKVFSYPAGETDIQAGPADFLRYFAGAQYVVTNSFHGTAFSVNFGKECYIPINDTLPPEKALHERITSLLTQVDATALMLPASNPVIPEDRKVDWDKVQENLSRMRQDSMEYLKNALED